MEDRRDGGMRRDEVGGQKRWRDEEGFLVILEMWGREDGRAR